MEVALNSSARLVARGNDARPRLDECGTALCVVPACGQLTRSPLMRCRSSSTQSDRNAASPHYRSRRLAPASPGLVLETVALWSVSWGLGVPADTPDGPGEIADYADRTWIVNSRNTTDDDTVRTQASVGKRTAPPEVAAPVPARQESGRGRQRPPRRSHSEYSGQAQRENDDQPAHARAVRTEDVDERGKQPWRKE